MKAFLMLATAMTVASSAPCLSADSPDGTFTESLKELRRGFLGQAAASAKTTREQTEQAEAAAKAAREARSFEKASVLRCMPLFFPDRRHKKSYGDDWGLVPVAPLAPGVSVDSNVSPLLIVDLTQWDGWVSGPGRDPTRRVILQALCPDCRSKPTVDLTIGPLFSQGSLSSIDIQIGQVRKSRAMDSSRRVWAIPSQDHVRSTTLRVQARKGSEFTVALDSSAEGIQVILLHCELR